MSAESPQSAATRVALEPFFLHREQVMGILGSQRIFDHRQRSTDDWSTPHSLATALGEALPQLGIGELQNAIHADGVQLGQVVGIEQEFDFRRAKERDCPGDMPIDFTARLNTDAETTIRGTFNAARLAADSSAGNVTGRKHAYIIGTVTARDRTMVHLRPVFVGIRSYVQDDESALFGISSPRRVYPSEVDQFRHINFAEPCTSSDLQKLEQTPEEVVKNSIAVLLGEPYVPKDWGGERSDLYTSTMFVRGVQVSTAWLFKGPGSRGPMTVRTLGSRGDQIVRLFSEPADVLVLQHYREITTAVISMMEAHAHDSRRPRRFMILDGADTARILRG
ncbi:hypothetical protein ACFXA2_17070 [Micromonospora chalcea]